MSEETKSTANPNAGTGLAPLNGYVAVISMLTYLIYIILWEALTIGGCAYVVFWKGQSGWWFLVGYTLSVAAYPQKKWKQLWQ